MILISFIGNHDAFSDENQTYGALLNIALQYKDLITAAYILVTPKTGKANYSEIASRNIAEIGKLNHSIKCEMVEVKIFNPIDYDLVYPHMLDSITKLYSDKKIAIEDEILVNITSGTPTMTACWILLSQSGIIKNAKLIQSFEKQFVRPNGRTTQVVNFNIDDFPKIEALSALKRQLTILSRNNKELSKRLNDELLDAELPELLGRSNSIREIKEQIITGIDQKIHILIVGERGTGKGVVAKAIWKRYHKEGEEQLAKLNCSHFTPTLLTSELFGYTKGSFTGADKEYEGTLSQNKGKMLFLDEIGNLPLEGQLMLLSVIEEGIYRKIGDNTNSNKIDIQILAATNKDVDDPAVFAQDLKDRFHEIIRLPPLRERKDDIPILINHFIGKYSNTENSSSPIILDDELMRKLIEYNWPGNIRSIEKCIEQIARRFKSGGIIKYKNLPKIFNFDTINDDSEDIYLPSLPLSIPLPEYNDQIIEKARSVAGNNMSEVDRLLCQKIGTEKQRRHRNKNKN